MSDATNGGKITRVLALICGFCCLAILGTLISFSLQLENQLQNFARESKLRTALASNLLEEIRRPAELAESQKLAKQAEKLDSYRHKTVYDLSLLSLDVALSEENELPRTSSARDLLLFEPQNGEILAKQGLDSFQGSLKTGHPALFAAIGQGMSKRARGGFWIIQGGQDWAVGPALPRGLRLLLRPKPMIPSASSSTKVSLPAAVTNSLVELAQAPSVAEEVQGQMVLLRWYRYGFIVFSLLAFFLGIKLYKTQFSEPLRKTHASARAWLNGDSDARVVLASGGSSARLLAGTINAIIEHADMRKQGRLRVIADGSEALASSLKLVGKGDLKVIPPTVPPELKPIAEACEEMIGALNERIFRLYDVALKVAVDANALNFGTSKIKHSYAAQLENIKAVGEEAENASESIREAPIQVQEHCKTLDSVVEAQRLASQRTRIKIGALGRRVTDLGGSAERLKKGMVKAAVIDEALDVLSLVGDEDVSADALEGHRVKAAALARNSRQALEGLKQLAASIRHDLEEIRTGVSGLSLEAIPEESEHPGKLAELIHQTMLDFGQLAERLMQALASVEASAASMHLGAQEWNGDRDDSNTTVTDLDLALGYFDLDGRLDQGLLERLNHLRDEYASLKDLEDVTSDGAAIISEIKKAAQESKQRLARMIDTVEATADSLRDNQA